jgi:hypothetical protein
MNESVNGFLIDRRPHISGATLSSSVGNGVEEKLKEPRVIGMTRAALSVAINACDGQVSVRR